MQKTCYNIICHCTQRRSYYKKIRNNAGIAQLVEQRIRNAQVVGSSPTTSSNKRRADCSPLILL